MSCFNNKNKGILSQDNIQSYLDLKIQLHRKYFDKEKIFIPINVNSCHWSLIIVNIKKKNIAYLNSYYNSGIL